MINIFSNTLGRNELQAIERVFKSRWVGRGKECEDFENEFADYLDIDKLYAINNCTAGLYLAIRTLGIKEGDEVILSTINFVACLSAVLEAKAIPVFADVDPITLNILPSEIERLRTDKTKAIIILHYGGNPAPMEEVLIAAKGIPIIEDNACSPVSRYKGHATGSIGAFGVWSFDAMKILVTGDGGMIHCDKVYRERLQTLRYLGLNESNATGMDKSKECRARWWEYELAEPSGRFIMNDITAAIGRAQLRKLCDFTNRREIIWDVYQESFKNLGDLQLPPETPDDCLSSYYLYWVKTSRRDELALYLKEKGIYTTFRYYPLHLVNKSKERLQNAEMVNDTALNIPLHQNLLDDNSMNIIVDAIRKFRW